MTTFGTTVTRFWKLLRWMLESRISSFRLRFERRDARGADEIGQEQSVEPHVRADVNRASPASRNLSGMHDPLFPETIEQVEAAPTCVRESTYILCPQTVRVAGKVIADVHQWSGWRARRRRTAGCGC